MTAPRGLAVAVARAEAERLGLKNVRFEVRDVAAFRGEAGYDLALAVPAARLPWVAGPYHRRLPCLPVLLRPRA